MITILYCYICLLLLPFSCLNINLSDIKDDPSSNQHNASVDLTRKRPRLSDDEDLSNGRDVSKQMRVGPDVHLFSTAQKDGSLQNAISNGRSHDVPTLDVELTPAEQMIAMIGALLAEGERGADSLEILISNIHPDLLADIVITNMKNLPKAPPPLTRHGDLPVTRQGSSHVQVLAPSAPLSSVQTSVATAQVPFSVVTSAGSTFAESTVNTLPVDSKRDPRRVNLTSCGCALIFVYVMLCLQFTIMSLNRLVFLLSHAGSSSPRSSPWSIFCFKCGRRKFKYI